MKDYIHLIESNETWLVNRILEYATRMDFTRYTSTLAEAWRLSITRLSGSLISAAKHYADRIPEMNPEDTYIDDPVLEFGVVESREHRKRGITLGMFLGLMKYYRETYTDLIGFSTINKTKKEYYKNFTIRCFDRIEIAYSIEWSSHGHDNLLKELQESNRKITNEKNKYLTIFESSYVPTIFLDDNLLISNLNQAATELFTDFKVAGSIYYNDSTSHSSFKQLNEQILQFLKNKQPETNFEAVLITNKGNLTFNVKLKKMQDVSRKFCGAVIMLDDITAQKKSEQKLLESETEFRNLVSDLQVGVILCDPKSEILISNPKALELLGLTEEQLLGRAAYDARWNVIQEDGSPFPENAFPVARAIATRQSVRDVIMGVYRPEKGDRVWLRMDAELHFNKDESVRQVICSIVDITKRKIVEDTLSKKNSLLNTLLKNIQIGVYMVAVPSGKPMLANEASLKLLGRSVLPDITSDTITQTFMLYKTDTNIPYPNDDLPLVVAMKGTSKYIDDVDVLKPDGTRVTLEVYGSPVYDDKGTIWASLISFQDITERKQSEIALKEREKELSSLAESMPQIVLTARADGWITYLNQQWVEYTGLSLEESYGYGWFSTFHPDNRQQAIDKWKKAVDNKALYSLECRLRCHDGNYKWWLVRGVPQVNEQGEIIKWFGTFTDIEKIKNTEYTLKQSEKQLLRLNDDKNRFISILGHDLKSPLSNILGFSELLIDDIQTLNTDEIKEYTGNIVKSARITIKLLEDILMWARTQQGNIPFKPQILNFREVTDKVLEILNPNAFAKNITVDNHSARDIKVYADSDMLKTVLLNIISNAIKFSVQEGLITINAERTDSVITVTISDNGIGIPPANLAKLFEISEVLTTKGTAGETGTGLGLLFCKELVEKHGGTIWTTSEVGKGSDFKFTLPLFGNQA